MKFTWIQVGLDVGGVKEIQCNCFYLYLKMITVILMKKYFGIRVGNKNSLQIIISKMSFNIDCNPKGIDLSNG